MFELFNGAARQAVIAGRAEAERLQHDYIGTEHLLLGLLHDREGVAVRVLRRLEADINRVRPIVERMSPATPSPAPVLGHLPFSPRALRCIEYAAQAAVRMGHDHVGTEHLLVGILWEGEGVAARSLAELGVTLKAAWDAILDEPPRGRGGPGARRVE